MIIIDNEHHFYGVTCTKCKTPLLYQDIDIDTVKQDISTNECRYIETISCPVCGNKITIKDYTIKFPKS